MRVYVNGHEEYPVYEVEPAPEPAKNWVVEMPDDLYERATKASLEFWEVQRLLAEFWQLAYGKPKKSSSVEQR
jgi:hypothetical protein